VTEGKIDANRKALKQWAEIQKSALPCHGKRFPLVDHFFALGSPIRASACDKKIVFHRQLPDLGVKILHIRTLLGLP
jgi:hypothetical protein